MPVMILNIEYFYSFVFVKAKVLHEIHTYLQDNSISSSVEGASSNLRDMQLLMSPLFREKLPRRY